MYTAHIYPQTHSANEWPRTTGSVEDYPRLLGPMNTRSMDRGKQLVIDTVRRINVRNLGVQPVQPNIHQPMNTCKPSRISYLTYSLHMNDMNSIYQLGSPPFLGAKRPLYNRLDETPHAFVGAERTRR